MAYFNITAKVEELNESSYTNRTTGEVVTKIQLSLVVPSMRERVLCELPLEKAPKTDTLDRWELEESWVVVSPTRCVRWPSSAPTPAQAIDAREATADERNQLQAARKAQKVAAKQRRAARAAEKQAAKDLAAAVVPHSA